MVGSEARPRVSRALAAGLGLVLACATGPSSGPPEPDASSSGPVDPGASADPSAETDPERDLDEGPALTRAEIRLVVRAKLPEIRACFALRSEPEPAADGASPSASAATSPVRAGPEGPIRARVALRFAIDASGKAREIVVEASDLADPVPAACLVAALARWQFPRPRGGRSLVVTYPFVYSSEAALRAAGLPRVEGTVAPEAVAAVFEARRGELDPCVPADAHGSLGVALRVDDSGRVTAISSYADTLPEGASACLLRVLSSWSFPPAARGDAAQVNHDLRW